MRHIFSRAIIWSIIKYEGYANGMTIALIPPNNDTHPTEERSIYNEYDMSHFERNRLWIIKRQNAK